MRLYVKYMVSLRCKMLVQAELEKLAIPYSKIDLGVIDTKEDITPEQRLQLQEQLQLAGLELIDDKKAMLIEQIKTAIINMVHYSDELPKINFSVHLSSVLNYDYTYLANLFSETEGRTIEQYILLHKIERVKELILYNELNLTEIARKMQYSSVAALSNQFKKMTGLTPSFYKSLRNKRRKNLENV